MTPMLQPADHTMRIQKYSIKYTLKNLQAIAEMMGVVLEKHKKGDGTLYHYWNRNEGGGSVGSAYTLREAYDDMFSYSDEALKNK